MNAALSDDIRHLQAQIDDLRTDNEELKKAAKHKVSLFCNPF
jgi:hypothetical protein